jgi:hypothetical protein
VSAQRRAAQDELIDAVARRVVELLLEEELVLDARPRLLTVAQVACEYGVSADWLYANAERLGAIRMGVGPRARLRFDREAIGARIAELAAPRSRRRRGTRASSSPGALLPIRETRG